MNKPMGIGPLGSPSAIFVRKFRWTLGSNILPEHFMKTVEIDFDNNQFTFEYIEVYLDGSRPLELHKWIDLDTHEDEEMVFRTYDGCGMELYRYTFKNLEIVSRGKSYFDYSSSEEATRKVTVKYESIIREDITPSERSNALVREIGEVVSDVAKHRKSNRPLLPEDRPAEPPTNHGNASNTGTSS